MNNQNIPPVKKNNHVSFQTSRPESVAATSRRNKGLNLSQTPQANS
jgi:hypothetical protein